MGHPFGDDVERALALLHDFPKDVPTLVRWLDDPADYWKKPRDKRREHALLNGLVEKDGRKIRLDALLRELISWAEGKEDWSIGDYSRGVSVASEIGVYRVRKALERGLIVRRPVPNNRAGGTAFVYALVSGARMEPYVGSIPKTNLETTHIRMKKISDHLTEQLLVWAAQRLTEGRGEFTSGDYVRAFGIGYQRAIKRVNRVYALGKLSRRAGPSGNGKPGLVNYYKLKEESGER